VAQGLQLLSAPEHPEVLRCATAEALQALGEAGVLGPRRTEGLVQAARLIGGIQQMLRLTAGDRFDERTAPEGQKRALAKFCDWPDFDALRAELMAAAERVSESYAELIDEPARVLEAERAEARHDSDHPPPT
jgi:glutamate-ammonia-ligase adenylyltransferase